MLQYDRMTRGELAAKIRIADDLIARLKECVALSAQLNTEDAMDNIVNAMGYVQDHKAEMEEAMADGGLHSDRRALSAKVAGAHAVYR